MTYSQADVEYVAMAIAEVDGVGHLLEHDCTSGYKLRLVYQLKAKLVLDEIYPKLHGKVMKGPNYREAGISGATSGKMAA
ncbi:hypothetical protein [Streptomyces sp. UNOC14_S4]|uniref:hypothetical protein n=1 Tax=Streptomyces sp. UNOC14_S4 TaxID=2872340 RepID=UPI001E3EC28B|nr:hypothetical protein [Streptomyces sp. UNOC14_S4]MCC3766455.1 hypothetical protein [Streptomyces sp. UNOC14_S4]